MPSEIETPIWTITTSTLLDGQVGKYWAQINDIGIAFVAELDWYFEPAEYELSAEAGLKMAEAARAERIDRLELELAGTRGVRFTVPA